MRRCLRAHTDEIAAMVRAVMEGGSPKAEANRDSAAQLEEWQGKSIERWRDVIESAPPSAPSRFPLGWYTVSCSVEGVRLPLPQLRDALQVASEVRLTGWTPWWQPTRGELAPYVHNDTIECWLGGEGADAAHSDFWRVSTSGQLFLIRGYNEDSLKSRGSQFSRVEPGKYFDLTLPVWRVAECLLYVARFAEAAGNANALVIIRVEWSGLRGRTLTSLDGRRPLFDGHRATSNESVSRLTVPAERLKTALPEIVRDLTAPLFLLFGFFQPPARMYAEEVDRLVRRVF
jgi:transcriptional regulator with XRE-family HTH domain